MIPWVAVPLLVRPRTRRGCPRAGLRAGDREAGVDPVPPFAGSPAAGRRDRRIHLRDLGDVPHRQTGGHRPRPWDFTAQCQEARGGERPDEGPAPAAGGGPPPPRGDSGASARICAGTPSVSARICAGTPSVAARICPGTPSVSARICAGTPSVSARI